jgi:hypothetical protein
MMKTLVGFCLLMLLVGGGLRAQSFEARVITNGSGYLEYQMRETSGTGIPTTTTDFMDIQFELRWAVSYSENLDVGLLCSGYNLIDGLGSRGNTGGFYWRVFAADDVPLQPQEDWVTNQWETIGQFKAVDPWSSGTGTFRLADQDWLIQGLNINIDGVDYEISVADSTEEYAYPTTVFDYVWKGGAAPSEGYDQYSWTCGLNWENECGEAYDLLSQPGFSSNCIIPGGLSYYPKNLNNYTSGYCNLLKMYDNSYLEIPEGKALYVTGSINVDAAAEIKVKNGGDLEIVQPD